MQSLATGPQHQPELHLIQIWPGDHAFGTTANVSIQIWIDQATQQDGVYMRQAANEIVRMYPGGFSNIHVIGGSSRLPTAGARAEFVGLLRDYSAAMGEVAILIEDTGFLASAMRSLLTGLRMATANRAGFRVFSSLEDLLLWLPAEHKRRTGIPVAANQVRVAVQYLKGACRADR